jgi:hypothetical protein
MSQMGIRWWQGLFRLWLLGTILWIGFACWAEAQIPPWSTGIVRSQVKVLGQTHPESSETRPPFDPNKPYGVVQPDGTIIEVVPFGIKTVAFVFAPPIFLLLVGSAIWWVASGFRPRTN